MPYSYENSRGQTYYLHGKEVTLQNGRTQQIYYFAREPKAGAALDAVPAGRVVDALVDALAAGAVPVPFRKGRPVRGFSTIARPARRWTRCPPALGSRAK